MPNPYPINKHQKLSDSQDEGEDETFHCLSSLSDQQKVIYEFKLNETQRTKYKLALKYKVSKNHISYIIENQQDILKSEKSEDVKVKREIPTPEKNYRPKAGTNVYRSETSNDSLKSKWNRAPTDFYESFKENDEHNCGDDKYINNTMKLVKAEFSTNRDEHNCGDDKYVNNTIKLVKTEFSTNCLSEVTTPLLRPTHSESIKASTTEIEAKRINELLEQQACTEYKTRSSMMENHRKLKFENPNAQSENTILCTNKNNALAFKKLLERNSRTEYTQEHRLKRKFQDAKIAKKHRTENMTAHMKEYSRKRKLQNKITPSENAEPWANENNTQMFKNFLERIREDMKEFRQKLKFQNKSTQSENIEFCTKENNVQTIEKLNERKIRTQYMEKYRSIQRFQDKGIQSENTELCTKENNTNIFKKLLERITENKKESENTEHCNKENIEYPEYRWKLKFQDQKSHTQNTKHHSDAQNQKNTNQWQYKDQGAQIIRKFESRMHPPSLQMSAKKFYVDSITTGSESEQILKFENLKTLSGSWENNTDDNIFKTGFAFTNPNLTNFPTLKLEILPTHLIDYYGPQAIRTNNSTPHNKSVLNCDEHNFERSDAMYLEEFEDTAMETRRADQSQTHKKDEMNFDTDKLIFIKREPDYDIEERENKYDMDISYEEVDESQMMKEEHIERNDVTTHYQTIKVESIENET